MEMIVIAVIKICAKVGCNKRIDYKDTYCDKHKREVNNTYNDQVRHASEFDKKVAKFYASTSYRKLRKKKMLEVNGLCQVCIRLAGIVNTAKIAHHIVPVRDDFDKRLDDDNIIMICNDCHEKLHDRINNRTLTIDELIKQLKSIN